eukprot:m.755425 g.755425  ORF g.755425 m.755425 type:complete len:637 (+) comp23181_c0_seq4:162-2072(+)
MGVYTILLLSAGVAATAQARPSAVGAKPSFLFILADDIGWSDFGYNNGTAHTPFIDTWTKQPGTVVMQDFHSGGTVCSPTRATVLTGRNHFRDCVEYVYDCSDMTECVPNFKFAPQRTFTIGDAVRQASPDYRSIFTGKWHLGSFYNDSEAHGGITSSPVTHGFDFFNATVEVAPTATTNCECRKDWAESCIFGHDNGPTHCGGGANPGGGPKGCCFNYWWPDDAADHGVTNLTEPVGQDDSQYVASVFENFLESRNGLPFMAQLSFHNCHIPFIATPEQRAECTANKTCRPPLPGSKVYNEGELDFYGCLNELDASVGKVLQKLKDLDYYENTMVWFTTDNGPEENCQPEGFCKGTLHRPTEGPGCAGPLRGRKRDIYEGGHRVPGIISYPAMVLGPARVSWDTVITMDFLATVMEVLALHNMSVSRPAAQAEWAFDGVSVLPILKNEPFPERGLGWMFDTPAASPQKGYGYRYGKWKYVVGSVSCTEADCTKPQLYDLSTDLGEHHDLAATQPQILAAIAANFTKWHASITNSIQNESKCHGPAPGPPRPPAPPAPPSSACTWVNDQGISGSDLYTVPADTKEACCGACRADANCVAADFNDFDCERNEPHCCHIKADNTEIPRAGSIACVPQK